ncbi:hypothetical protein SEA_ZUKO_109 [Streptomyces phage Zuko]|uniref:Prolyl 4-hydroxylase alpha subunit Fe(2+) 2OG dioxygenase domain-containing protein n=1 Tax=Streptomyces phage Zuko TaxID=2601695 RepID=A0A5J6D7A3_9CAUD|nr:hypothetical protein PP630_gp109 [Streptomyces phage Zuko]QEQ93687.1 hypothetical protein SEA_ZUKO_109 [Streptomyces phage Zuko]
MPLFTPDQALAFRNAEPFPHIVLDGFWSDDELSMAAAEFPEPADPRWKTYRDPKEWGKRCMDEPHTWPRGVAQLMAHLQSPVMCEALEDLTGLRGITSDAVGGGMHMTGEGGRLDMHVDFNVHPDGKRLRKLNVLVFMNREWNTEWGGTLYLGEDRDRAVFPGWNRMVIFECSDKSWHGHPEPIVGGAWRKSVAAYFYVPMDEVVEAHTTTWLER